MDLDSSMDNMNLSQSSPKDTKIQEDFNLRLLLDLSMKLTLPQLKFIGMKNQHSTYHSLNPPFVYPAFNKKCLKNKGKLIVL